MSISLEDDQKHFRRKRVHAHGIVGWKYVQVETVLCGASDLCTQKEHPSFSDDWEDVGVRDLWGAGDKNWLNDIFEKALETMSNDSEYGAVSSKGTISVKKF